jgi:hypothetical protein
MKLDYPSPVLNLQAAAAAPTLIRASKTFTGAANLGATGVNELFTTTGAVLIDGFWVRCTTTLEDSVDGALFKIGVTGDDDAFTSTLFEGVFDIDTVVAGTGLHVGEAGIAGTGSAVNLSYLASLASANAVPVSIFANIIMTISTQAITGGTLQFYILYRGLSSDGALTLGAGMTAI